MDADKTKALRIFFEVHSGLPREAPGSRASTLRALEMAALETNAPRVLDIGCGPGAQTIDLAMALPGAQITAVDLHEPFLADLSARAAAAGCADRIETLAADMSALPVTPSSYDLIWSEGAAYIMGVEAALRAWRPLLAAGGKLALTDAVWLSAHRSAEAQRFWQEYPDMGDAARRRSQIAACGYTLLGEFVLPEEDWWEPYYTPMEARLAALEARYKDDAEALSVLAEHRVEIDTYRRFSKEYGYAFFVMART